MNQAAHCLERIYVFGSDLKEWEESSPSFLVGVLANDLI